MLNRMKTGLTAGLSALVLATSFVALPTVSQAAQSNLPAGSYQVADNWNNHGGDWRWRRHGYENRGRYGHRDGYYRRDNNWGGAAAAGVIGLAAGAIIANNANRSYAGDNYYEYCSARFKSFNPRTGTYTGYDGLQHRCVVQ
jgi:hypothetical protein